MEKMNGVLARGGGDWWMTDLMMVMNDGGMTKSWVFVESLQWGGAVVSDLGLRNAVFEVIDSDLGERFVAS